MNQGWSVNISEGEHVQCTEDEVLAHIRSGNIDKTTLAWRPGMEGWMSLQDIPEFQHLFESQVDIEPPPLPIKPSADDISPDVKNQFDLKVTAQEVKRFNFSFSIGNIQLENKEIVIAGVNATTLGHLSSIERIQFNKGSRLLLHFSNEVSWSVSSSDKVNLKKFVAILQRELSQELNGEFLIDEETLASDEKRGCVGCLGLFVIATIFSLIVGMVESCEKAKQARIDEANRAREAILLQKAKAKQEEELRARIEHLRGLAPQVIKTWEVDAQSAKDSFLKTGQMIKDTSVFQNPLNGECPEMIDICKQARRSMSEIYDSISGFQVWLSNYHQLEASSQILNSNNLIYRSQFNKIYNVYSFLKSKPEGCPKTICTRKRSRFIKKAGRLLDKKYDNIIKSMSSIQNIKLAYADLREEQTYVETHLLQIQSDTYHNCRFRSKSRWRAFKVKSIHEYPSMHIYCERGSSDCDQLYQNAHSPTGLSKIILRYPRRNSVCEEDQAYLVYYEY